VQTGVKSRGWLPPHAVRSVSTEDMQAKHCKKDASPEQDQPGAAGRRRKRTSHTQTPQAQLSGRIFEVENATHTIEYAAVTQTQHKYRPYLPINSCSRMRPVVVSASKSGIVSPMFNAASRRCAANGSLPGAPDVTFT
jgi:hypothetical protein